MAEKRQTHVVIVVNTAREVVVVGEVPCQLLHKGFQRIFYLVDVSALSDIDVRS